MSRLQTFCGDQNGSAVVEFAMIAPVLLMTLAGVLDMSYNYYAQAQLQGAVQHVAGLSTVEGAEFRHEDLDRAVRDAVHRIVADAELEISRSSYANFSDIAQPDDFTDVDDKGVCNDGEPFEDANGNGFWMRTADPPGSAAPAMRCSTSST
ncbi:pilus assembly protein [Altererythrobacter sp. SALINAS58]|uniref:TadE/TadG family type IV pilus assembly protein n=1 Tax=Alteripontixanthobacter muriae TaxID=2705546 RepID=UPI00157750F9|nr:TadE family protein [Alteripontixanthobacter muriae]NTZ41643.1 pilus assembly protein [Alteripontixanthobacter muriae]